MAEIRKHALYAGASLAGYCSGSRSSFLFVRLMLPLALLFLAQISLADETNTHKFEAKGGDFSILVPTNWAEMDPQVVQALVDPYAEEKYADKVPILRYGYGPPISDDIPDPPYIAVQVRKNGRLPDRLVVLQSRNDFLRTNIARMLRTSGVLERNITETRYDTNKHMVRFSFTKIGPLVRDRLRITNLTYFTEEGAINLTSVCSVPQWENWSNTIETAFSSFQLADRLHYKPRGISVLAESGSGFGSFMMIMATFIITPIVWMIYKRRVGGVMSDEI
jgi:hypothetical protein